MCVFSSLKISISAAEDDQAQHSCEQRGKERNSLLHLLALLVLARPHAETQFLLPHFLRTNVPKTSDAEAAIGSCTGLNEAGR